MVTRRWALVWLVSLAALAGAQAGEPAAARDGFRFVQLSDLHGSNAKVNPPPRFALDVVRKDLVHSFALIDAAVREINEKVKPDFVVVTGDLVDDWRDREALIRVKLSLDKLACPYYPIIGNHDSSDAWRQVFGPGRLNYTFHHGGWRFIAVDSLRGLLDKPTLAWLDIELKADTKAPTALLIHHPIAVPDLYTAGAKAAGKETGSLLGNAADLTERLGKAGNVRAVFAGHIHWATELRRDGVLYSVAPALVTTGHGYRLVEVHGTEIKTELKNVEP